MWVPGDRHHEEHLPELLWGDALTWSDTSIPVAATQPPPSGHSLGETCVSRNGFVLMAVVEPKGLFFQRHYPVSSVIFCVLDPQDRKWITDGPSSRVFGFMAWKQSSTTDNVCHLFAEHDP
ncbi:Tensin-3 [Camelus dromedarius]|uniref:Tensin-3 n=1 Tax=Camelus dromedarius TaxID=9838 RepID=A0A5N4C4F3_CAMDR|nr:Tensin-3 [Camelus dromedarius]